MCVEYGKMLGTGWTDFSSDPIARRCQSNLSGLGLVAADSSTLQPYSLERFLAALVVFTHVRSSTDLPETRAGTLCRSSSMQASACHFRFS